jgi:hypothetical protein
MKKKKYTIVYQESWHNGGSHHLTFPRYKHIVVLPSETLSSVVTKTGLVPTWVVHGHLKEVTREAW